MKVIIRDGNTQKMYSGESFTGNPAGEEAQS